MNIPELPGIEAIKQVGYLHSLYYNDAYQKVGRECKVHGACIDFLWRRLECSGLRDESEKEQ